jgi:hypothetical protein
MDILRRGGKLEIDLNEDDARGLFAILSGQHQTVSADQLQKGQVLYTWFFQNVQELAANYQRAGGLPKWTGTGQ